MLSTKKIMFLTKFFKLYLKDRLSYFYSVFKLHWTKRYYEHRAKTPVLVPFIYKGLGQYRSIKPKQVVSEIQELYNILHSMKAKYVCEIGTYRGGTFYLWCQAAMSNAVLVAIDLARNSLDNAYSNKRIKFYNNFKKSRQQNLYFIQADSHNMQTPEQVHGLLQGKKLDFLFIDGDHSYEGVLRDFTLYLPLVRQGGIIAFHDILPRKDNQEVQVYKFWDEIKLQYRHHEIIADTGQFANFIGIGIIWL